MPWPTGKAFATAHNKKLKGPAANTAAKTANALLAKGYPEGQAIRIANAQGDKAKEKFASIQKRKRAGLSPR